MGLIDGDELLNSTIYNPLHAPYITKQDVNAPTIKATVRKPHESRRKLPCTCGCKRISIWYGSDYCMCVCDKCMRDGMREKTEIGAIRAWNDMIREEITNATD